ncbi:MAG TPA: autotransporter domain-containing protein, partial [Rhizomicrobium sp.]|nr:autotransporter domain-containing protein [Rhizomicrobium sp.]
YGIYAITGTGANAINITTGSGVTITSSNGPAIAAGGNTFGSGGITNTGPINITNNAALQGLGAAGNAVVEFYNGGTNGGTITVVNNGTIAAVGNAPAAIAVEKASTGTFNVSPNGTVNLTNNGSITGLINLSGAKSAAIANSGTWTLSGVNALPAGTSLGNTGTIRASGSTTIQAGLANSGTIDLHGANPAAGDTLTLTGPYTGGGKLSLDAALGVTASGSACGTQADCLTLTSSSGVTGIIVNNTVPAGSAGANSGGILLINGASAAGQFVIDPATPGYDNGAIDAGFFTYNLNFANNQVRLVSAPNRTAFQAPVLVTAAQNVWFETSPWLDRQADLRVQMGPDGSGSVTPGIWTKATGNFLHRTASLALTSPGGAILSQNLSYAQNGYALIGGADIGRQGAFQSGDALLAGLMFGYLNSDLRFQDGSARAGYGGALVGAYVTYLDEEFFADAAFKANFLSTRYDALSGISFKPGADALGGELDMGRRFRLGEKSFVEPLGSFAFAKTDIDAVPVGGISLTFPGNKSARLSQGLRAGSGFSEGDYNGELSLTGRVWEEFAGNGAAAVASAL